MLIYVFIYEDLMLHFNYSIIDERFLPKSIIFVIIFLLSSAITDRIYFNYFISSKRKFNFTIV